MIPRSFGALLLVVLAASPAMAKPWAAAMFKESTHDFGVVARGAKVEYRFAFENPYLEDVHIASVRSSCGCTSPSATKTLLKTYETAEIVAELDTRRFSGHKEATITVVFDQPFPAEVQLHVYSFIRGDVVFEPGLVQFGSLGEGQAAQKRVTITYAGRADWKILEVASTAGYLEAKFKEVGRNLDPTIRATQVTYDLEVSLKESALPGYFKEQLMLRTNDPNPQTAPRAADRRGADRSPADRQSLGADARRAAAQRKRGAQSGGPRPEAVPHCGNHWAGQPLPLHRGRPGPAGPRDGGSGGGRTHSRQDRRQDPHQDRPWRGYGGSERGRRSGRLHRREAGGPSRAGQTRPVWPGRPVEDGFPGKRGTSFVFARVPEGVTTIG